jgi:ElaB/YqjD/DUF883 family membrane-anchored ribosome-binding protein
MIFVQERITPMMTSGPRQTGVPVFENGKNLESFTTSSSELAQQAQERFSDMAGSVKMFVKNKPMAALGAALAAGVFLGWLIKRR